MTTPRAAVVTTLLRRTRTDGSCARRAFQINKDASLRRFRFHSAGEKIEPEAYLAMANALKHDAITESMVLDVDGVGGEGVDALAEIAFALSEHSTLKNFHLSVGICSHDSLVFEFAEVLRNRGLNTFKFGGFFFMPSQIQVGFEPLIPMAMVDAVDRNDTLINLELELNGWDSDTFVAFTKALAQNTSLRRCILKCAIGTGYPPLKISDGEIRAFSKFLRKNRTIKYLNFDGFDHEGLMSPMYSALADALESNYSLTKFAFQPIYVSNSAEAGSWPREVRVRVKAVLLRNQHLEWNAVALLARVGGHGSSVTGLQLLCIRSLLGADVFASYIFPSSFRKRTYPTLPAAGAGLHGTTKAVIQDLASGDDGGRINAVKACGTEGVIDDHILHRDPPARVAASEAAAVVAVQEAGFIERLITLEPATPELAAEVLDTQTDQVFVVQFKRCPKELLVALAEGLALQRCRQMLEAAGHNWSLPNGDMVFVHPNSYRVTIQAWTSCEPKSCFSLLFAENLEYLVEESIKDVGKGAFVKERSFLNVVSDTTDNVDSNQSETALEEEQKDWAIVTSRTFLNTAPLHRSSASVAQSSTEVHQGGLNPRRCCLAETNSSN